MIANTAGWDTDCNSGNVGCIMGVKLGLSGINAGPDWRGPVADRMYLPTADGGRCITDAARESRAIIKGAKILAGEEFKAPKNGAKFHFEFPGSVQGFVPEQGPETRDVASVENVAGHSRSGSRSLAIHYKGVTLGRSARAATATFMNKESTAMPGYSLFASPTLYAGQSLQTVVEADAANAAGVTVRPYIRFFPNDETLEIVRGPETKLAAGSVKNVEWKIPETEGPIAEVGVEVSSPTRADGTVYVDFLTWSGAPNVTLGAPSHNRGTWKRAWVNAADRLNHHHGQQEVYRIASDEGPQLLIQGTREWADYTVSAAVRPHLAKAAGIAARVQGLKRYYALVLSPGNKVRLLKQLNGVSVLAEAEFKWNLGDSVKLSLTTKGTRLTATANDTPLFTIDDAGSPLTSGSVALLIEEGRLDAGAVSVRPA